LDTSFGIGGVVTGPVVGTYGLNAALYAPGAPNAGKIAVVGQTPGEKLQIARFNTNGSLDSTFGSGGTVVGQIGEYPSIVVTADGKVVIAYAAEAGIGSAYHFGVARYNPDGSPDKTFGSNGYVNSTASGYLGSDFDAVALQPNGDIIGAGSVFTAAGQAFAVARYLPSEPQIGSFTANGNSVPIDGSITLTVANLSDGNPNSTITQVAIYLDSNGDGVLEPGTDTLLGYATQSNGVWTLTFSPSTFSLTSGSSYTVFAMAEDSYGVFGDPSALTLTVP
jgi:uncharacterized delta-60 repeat protein